MFKRFSVFMLVLSFLGCGSQPGRDKELGTDIIKPQVSSFQLTSGSPTSVSMVSFTLEASDNIGITGWQLTETGVAPLADNGMWTADKPSSYKMSTCGVNEIYIWVKDAAGNISDSIAPISVSFEPAVWINELHYDDNNSTGDINEGVEIAGTAGLNLGGWKIIFYNATGSVEYGNISLTGVIPNQQNDFGTKFFYFTGIQNGAPDGLALLNPEGEMIQLLSYEGTFTVGTTMSSDIGVFENAVEAGFSLQLEGTGNKYSDFHWVEAKAGSYGSVNGGQVMQ